MRDIMWIVKCTSSSVFIYRFNGSNYSRSSSAKSGKHLCSWN